MAITTEEEILDHLVPVSLDLLSVCLMEDETMSRVPTPNHLECLPGHTGTHSRSGLAQVLLAAKVR